MRLVVEGHINKINIRSTINIDIVFTLDEFKELRVLTNAATFVQV